MINTSENTPLNFLMECLGIFIHRVFLIWKRLIARGFLIEVKLADVGMIEVLNITLSAFPLFEKDHSSQRVISWMGTGVRSM